MEVFDSFNGRWVESAAFVSPRILIELLRLTGEWTTGYYSSIDPAFDGKYVGYSGGTGPTSLFWRVGDCSIMIG